MAATTSQRLIVNVDSGSLVPTFEGMTGVTQPRFVLGDTVPIELYLVKSTGGGASAITATDFPAGSNVTMAIGVVNQSPTDGKWKLVFGGDETAELDFDISDAELETALNGLASITAAGGVTVGKVGNQYQITFDTVGNKGAFLAQSISLFPASAIQIQTLKEGSAVDNETVLVNLAVSPIALVDTFTDVPEPSVSQTSNTFTLSGSIKGGSFRVRLNWSQDSVSYNTWTQPILPDSNPSVISQIIFQSLVNDGWGVKEANPTTNAWGCTVTLISEYSWRVDFVAPKFKTPIPAVIPVVIDIDGSDLTYLPCKKGEISVATAEAIAYLGNASSKAATLEVQVESGTVTQTLIQTNCTINGEVIPDGAYAPLTLGVPISEAVANDRFVRRDADQTIDDTTADQIWENITGQTTVAGRDIADAIGASSAPSAANPFATIADVGPAYDQSLNSTDAVAFTGVEVAGQIVAQDLKIKTGATEFLTINSAGEIGTTAAASFGSLGLSGAVTITGTGLDTVYAHNSVSFDGVSVLTPTDLTLTDGTISTVTLSGTTGAFSLTTGGNTVSLDANFGLTFSSTNALSDAIYSAGTNASTGGTHIDVADYPDEVRVVINGVTYAMPARVI